MRSTSFRLALVLSTAFLGSSPAAAPQATNAPAVPVFQSIGPLSFGADGVLFAADAQGATIYAVNLGTALPAGASGTKTIASIDAQIAALLGAEARDISVTDLAVQPKTGNAFLSVMRGQGAGAKAVLLRVDGAGKIDVVDFARTTATKVMLPNSAQRVEGITDMAFADGTLYVAGLSNEEFASKLRSIPYPFTSVDRGASVEIFHGNRTGNSKRARPSTPSCRTACRTRRT